MWVASIRSRQVNRLRVAMSAQRYSRASQDAKQQVHSKLRKSDADNENAIAARSNLSKCIMDNMEPLEAVCVCLRGPEVTVGLLQACIVKGAGCRVLGVLVVYCSDRPSEPQHVSSPTRDARRRDSGGLLPAFCRPFDVPQPCAGPHTGHTAPQGTPPQFRELARLARDGRRVFGCFTFAFFHLYARNTSVVFGRCFITDHIHNTYVILFGYIRTSVPL